MGETPEGVLSVRSASKIKPSLKMRYIKYWLALIVFLVPLVFVPSLFDVYILPKILIFLLGVLFGWIGFLLPAVIDKNKKNNQTIFFDDKKILIFSLLLALAFIISSFIQPNTSARLRALSGTTAVVVGGLLLMLLIKQIRGEGQEAKKTQRLILGAFTASTVVLSLVAIFQYTGLLAKFFIWELFSVNTWTPTGSIITTIVLIILAIVYVLMVFLKLIKADFKLLNLIGLLLLLVILALGAIMGFIALIESGPVLINLQNAWVVAVENFKGFLGVVFGVGPDNFRIAYARFRPVTINNTDAWGVYFNNSFGNYLNLLTEIGLLGLLAFMVLAITSWRKLENINHHLVNARSEIIILALLVLAFFVSFDVNLWFVFFILLGLSGLFVEERGVGLGESRPKLIVNRYLLLTVLIGILLVAGSWYSRAVWADVLFARSLAAFGRGEGGNAYNWQVEALEKNPHSDIYHLAYAQTNLTLASVFSQNEDPTEQDQQQIAILIQQAIREAKNAVAVNPFWFNNWLSLANVYRQIIGVAQEAEQWATDSLRQAIVLDPVNPNLRIELGGLFFALGDFESTQRQFETAVNLKPDHANAHYNLAAVYIQQEKWTHAALELQTVLSLVEPGSADFNKVQEELAAIKDRLPESKPVEDEERETDQQLQHPQPLPESSFEPIDLPEEEAAPPRPVLEEPGEKNEDSLIIEEERE